MTEGIKHVLYLSAEEQTINQRIAYLRKAKQLTVREFASKLNVSDKLIARWEQEGKVPSLDEVVNISKTFNITLDYLVNGKRTAADAEALMPPPPPAPPFIDPIHSLVKKIDDIINRTKLQKYREQLFPGSSEEVLYGLAERVRWATLDDWNRIKVYDNVEAKYYKWDVFGGIYHEDRRSPNKPIDEKYWAQVEERNVYNGRNHMTDDDRRLLRHGFGVFIIENFGRATLKDLGGGYKYGLDHYDLTFGLDVNALIALDNFEIYSKLTALGIPLYRDYNRPPKSAALSSFFTGLDFEEGFYKKIKNESRYDNNLLHKITHRNLSVYPFTYEDLVGLNDVRFLSLLKKEELDMLLDKVNFNNSRVWEVILALIEGGAMKKKLVKLPRTRTAFDYNDIVKEEDDVLCTLMLYELAKIKTGN